MLEIISRNVSKLGVKVPTMLCGSVWSISQINCYWIIMVDWTAQVAYFLKWFVWQPDEHIITKHHTAQHIWYVQLSACRSQKKNSKQDKMFTCHNIPSKICISQAYYPGFTYAGYKLNQVIVNGIWCLYASTQKQNTCVSRIIKDIGVHVHVVNERGKHWASLQLHFLE